MTGLTICYDTNPLVSDYLDQQDVFAGKLTLSIRTQTSHRPLFRIETQSIFTPFMQSDMEDTNMHAVIRNEEINYLLVQHLIEISWGLNFVF